MSQSESRVALITGATGAIGIAIAQGIAALDGYEVILVARDAEKAAGVVDQLRRQSATSRVRHEQADLSSNTDILALAKRWRGPLHILVNNAAECPRQRELNAEGIERQLATNVLGYFRMIAAFRQILADSAPARIVNVASYWAGDLDLADLEFQRRHYDNNTAYRQSKQANRMLTVAFAEQLRDSGITVNACHPGDVNSKLANDLGFGGFESAQQAAMTPVWLASAALGGQVTAKYFEHRQQRQCSFSNDRAAVEALFQACNAYGNRINS